jgi:protein SCO1/2
MMRRSTALLVALLTVISACGSSREFAGYVRTPAPSIKGVTLPQTDTGALRELVAMDEKLLVVYFGYTNCPDMCPTTMQDLTVALRRLDDPSQVEVAMVTIDPSRDLEVLDSYVKSFIPTAIALGTTDASALAAAAEPFGVNYLVEDTSDGVEVAHTTSLYVVDDDGQLLLTWPFGVPSVDISADLKDLLDGRRS